MRPRCRAQCWWRQPPQLHGHRQARRCARLGAPGAFPQDGSASVITGTMSSGSRGDGMVLTMGTGAAKTARGAAGRLTARAAEAESR